MTGALPSFTEFYRAVNRDADDNPRDPFPWQRRLAEQVARDGWPREIGVPTGLGKTAAIDIAVWSLAAQADRRPAERTVPTRIWYVVDRRLLVDTASDHATRLARRLVNDNGAARQVGERLRSIAGLGRADAPLFVSRLRGGTGLGVRAPDPSQPAVICSTVAMYGSRLLFRGFGSSRSMFPIDAALAGTDALVLLDEAHLAVTLQTLIETIPACDANRTSILRLPGSALHGPGPASLLPPGRCYPTVVSLTATGHHRDRFDLDDDDRANPIVQQRLSAAKPTDLIGCAAKALPRRLADLATEHLAGLGTVGAAVVFVNRPVTARDVAAEIPSAARRVGITADVVVLTGQLRDPDADTVRSRLLDPSGGCPSGSNPQRERTLVVVATQTLEVGADLDFDVCISETAGVRAITQRWGRLNRLGTKPHARAALCHPTDDKPGPLYGREPADLWARLTSGEDTTVDLGPAVISDRLGEPDDDPSTVFELLPAHLWEFAKTSLPPEGAAPPELFFAGLDDDTLRVSVMWRAEIPEPGHTLYPPPHDSEIVAVALHEARDFVERATADIRVVTSDGVTVAASDVRRVRPGSLVVVDAAAGGYSTSGWDPDSTATVADLSPTLRRVLHLTATAWTNLTGSTPTEPERRLIDDLRPDPDDGPDPARDHAIAVELLDSLRGHLAAEFGDARHPVIERIDAGDQAVLTWDTPRPSRDARVDSLDELSVAATAQLSDHLAAVGELAARLAIAVGLPTPLAATIETSGRYHDLGKADRRFQRWLGNDGARPYLAKSATTTNRWQAARVAAGWPQGGRHELLSVQLLDAALAGGANVDDADLVRHLVLAHHGHGRPLCPTTDAGAALRTHVVVGDETFDADTDTRRPDWDQPERFRSLNERFGYWGLALLEALVRQADHIPVCQGEVRHRV